MKYEEAVVDANLALQVVPTRIEAYQQLADCLIATQRFPEAAKLLKILSKKDESNTTLKSQYDMLINQKAKPNTEQDYFQQAKEYYNNAQKLPNTMKQVRMQSKLVSNPENFQNLKKFMEDDHIANRRKQDEAEAKEKNITPEEARMNRDKALKKATERVRTDEIVWMSDEMSAGEEESMNSSAPSVR